MGRQDPHVPTHPLPILLPSLRWRCNFNQVKNSEKLATDIPTSGVHLLVHKLHSGSLETQQVVESRPPNQAAPGNPPALLTHACHLLLTSTLLLLHLQLCPMSLLLIPLQLLPKERERTKKVRTRRSLTKSNKRKRRGNQRMAKKNGRAAMKTKTELNTIQTKAKIKNLVLMSCKENRTKQRKKTEMICRRRRRGNDRSGKKEKGIKEF